jgi:hypothetical protein
LAALAEDPLDSATRVVTLKLLNTDMVELNLDFSKKKFKRE